MSEIPYWDVAEQQWLTTTIDQFIGPQTGTTTQAVSQNMTQMPVSSQSQTQSHMYWRNEEPIQPTGVDNWMETCEVNCLESGGEKTIEEDLNTLLSSFDFQIPSPITFASTLTDINDLEQSNVDHVSKGTEQNTSSQPCTSYSGATWNSSEDGMQQLSILTTLQQDLNSLEQMSSPLKSPTVSEGLSLSPSLTPSSPGSTLTQFGDSDTEMGLESFNRPRRHLISSAGHCKCKTTQEGIRKNCVKCLRRALRERTNSFRRLKRAGGQWQNICLDEGLNQRPSRKQEFYTPGIIRQKRQVPVQENVQDVNENVNNSQDQPMRSRVQETVGMQSEEFVSIAMETKMINPTRIENIGDLGVIRVMYLNPKVKMHIVLETCPSPDNAGTGDRWNVCPSHLKKAVRKSICVDAAITSDSMKQKWKCGMTNINDIRRTDVGLDLMISSSGGGSTRYTSAVLSSQPIKMSDGLPPKIDDTMAHKESTNLYSF